MGAFSRELTVLLNGLTHRNPWFDALARVAAEFVLPTMLAWFAVAAYVRYGDSLPRYGAVITTVGLLLTVGLAASMLIARTLKEPRPYLAVPQIKPLFIPLMTHKSFPSNHAFGAFLVLFCAVCFSLPWVGVFAVMAILVALGRVVVGVHYLHDVLGGIVLALLLVMWSGLTMVWPAEVLVMRLWPFV